MSFIAAAYKISLAALDFVAEAYGWNNFRIPALIGAAVAYPVSGDASVAALRAFTAFVRLPKAVKPAPEESFLLPASI
jgi:hypothetical protein